MGQQAYCIVLNVIFSVTHFIVQASTGSLNCTFDDDFCDWTSDKDGDFVWKVAYKQSIGSETVSDHTTGDGFYIYMKAKYQQKGDRARIKSPLQTPGAHCLTLWYNMNSRNLGALNIYVKTASDRETLIFAKDTSIGSRRWQKAVISHKTNVNFQVVLEGVRGGSSSSDIAVDDIFMTDELCAADCNFESGLCDWVQDLSDDFDWSRHRGGTSTPNTGPQGDHTFGHGYYIYIDTSEARKNTNARIFSPWLREGKYCFSFWYYMFGKHVETLTVQTGDVNQNKSVIVEITGAQKEQWIQENAFIHATSGFQIIIEGTVKDWWNHGYGDIAIDDVQILSCQDCLIPKIANGIMSGPRNNTTYNQTVDIVCEEGYDLIGNKSITCQADGYWSAFPTCDLREPVNTSALTAVYVTVPLAVVGLFIALITVIWRKRILRLCVIRGSHEQVKKEQPQPKTLFNNMAYSETFNENQSNQDGDISQDEEYAVVADNMNELGQGDIPAYYNIVDAAVTSIKEHEHTYNHTTISGRLVTDNTYSHLAGDKNMTESKYNTTEFPFSGHTSSQLNTNPRNNNYDVLNTNKTQQRCGIDAQPDIQHEEDSEYDHAQAGGTDPKDIDDYSNLNVETDKYRPECSEIKYGTNTKEQTERATKAYKQSEEETPEYYVLEPQPVSRGEDERHNFVLKREDS